MIAFGLLQKNDLLTDRDRHLDSSPGECLSLPGTASFSRFHHCLQHKPLKPDWPRHPEPAQGPTHGAKLQKLGWLVQKAGASETTVVSAVIRKK